VPLLALALAPPIARLSPPVQVSPDYHHERDAVRTHRNEREVKPGASRYFRTTLRCASPGGIRHLQLSRPEQLWAADLRNGACPTAKSLRSKPLGSSASRQELGRRRQLYAAVAPKHLISSHAGQFFGSLPAKVGDAVSTSVGKRHLVSRWQQHVRPG
jgi:hypothetical protein